MTEEVQLTRAWAKFAMSSTSGKEGYECWASDAADEADAASAVAMAKQMRADMRDALAKGVQISG